MTANSRVAETAHLRSFRDYRLANIHVVNDVAFRFVALMVVVFNAWDWYVDPENAPLALAIRLFGAGLIIISGLLQRQMHRVALAPWFAKFRLLISAAAIAGALAVLEQGFLVGLSGLVAALLGSAYVAVDRRDLFPLYLPPLLLTVGIMMLAGLDRFVFINALCFLGLTLVIGYMLAAVLESSYRRSFELEQALARESRTDALTGTSNRRELEEQAGVALRHARRSHRPVSVLLLDLDRFKLINDTHGHPAGDLLLQAVAKCCQALVRESDHFGRWGGEEFLALLPDATPEQAAHLAERMREAVAALQVSSELGPMPMTVSIGVAGAAANPELDPPVQWRGLVKAADDALYRAKSEGRNRVVMA